MVTSFIHFHTMKQLRIVFLFGSIFFSSKMNAQNLVPNPSFEIYDTCPHGGNEVQNATGWRTIYNSPDYFNSCSQGGLSVPTNYFGFQEPKDLNEHGYVGLIGDYQYSVREMFGITLIEPLEIGKKYFFSFYYNAAYRVSGLKTYNCFTDKIGMKLIANFTDTIGLGESLIDNNPILYSNKILSDTLNWTLFSGSFIADSAYTFLIIGNFFKKENINHECYDSTAIFSYTYIDHVCLSSKSNECSNNNTYVGQFSAYPNPATGIFTIIDNFNQQSIKRKIIIYNTIGEIVSKLDFFEGEVTIDISNFSRGVYLIYIDENVLKLILI